MDELFMDLLKHGLPKYQQFLLEELGKYRGTKGIRQIVASHIFTAPECDRILKIARDHYKLKNSEMEALA